MVPVVLGQPMLRLYLLAEHTGCPMVPEMLENSRTVHTNAVVRFLAWNMPYHAEHHAYAAIPFHALPRTHAALAPFIPNQGRQGTRACTVTWCENFDQSALSVGNRVIFFARLSGLR